MRCLLLPLMMLSSTTAFVAPVAPARPHHVVRAEPEKAVAKKKGIPLALLIWPLIAVGDDVRAQCQSSSNPTPRRHRRTVVYDRPRYADLRLASPAAPRGAGHRDAGAALLKHELPQEVSSVTCYLGRRRRRRRATSLRRSISLVNHTGLDHRPRRVARRYRSERRPWRRL